MVTEHLALQKQSLWEMTKSPPRGRSLSEPAQPPLHVSVGARDAGSLTPRHERSSWWWGLHCLPKAPCSFPTCLSDGAECLLSCTYPCHRPGVTSDQNPVPVLKESWQRELWWALWIRSANTHPGSPEGPPCVKSPAGPRGHIGDPDKTWGVPCGSWHLQHSGEGTWDKADAGSICTESSQGVLRLLG